MTIGPRLRQKSIDLQCTRLVRVVPQCAFAHCMPPRSCAIRIYLAQQPDDILGRICMENFLSKLEEQFDSGPSVRDETSASAGGFEDARRRRESHLGHGFAIDIENHSCRAVHTVVIAGPNMPYPSHI